MNFEFNNDEANVILFALSKLPYESVFLLIEKMQRQAKEQENKTEK